MDVWCHVKKWNNVRGFAASCESSVSFEVVRRGRLRWFGHVERKADEDWVKKCQYWLWKVKLVEVGVEDMVRMCEQGYEGVGAEGG